MAPTSYADVFIYIASVTGLTWALGMAAFKGVQLASGQATLVGPHKPVTDIAQRVSTPAA